MWSALCPPLQKPLFLAPEFRTVGATPAVTHTSPRAFAQSVLRAPPAAGSSHVLRVLVEMSLQRGLPDHPTPKSRHALSPPTPHSAREAPRGWGCSGDRRTGLLLPACPGKQAPPGARRPVENPSYHCTQKAAKYSTVRMCQDLVNESLND